MARLARADVFDPLTGRDHEHRKQWIEDRMRFLARGFGIDVLGFSILASQFHVVLRNRPVSVLRTTS